MTESQTFKKRSDFQSNDDYAVYVRENIQVSAPHSPFPTRSCHKKLSMTVFCTGRDDGEMLSNIRGGI